MINFSLIDELTDNFHVEYTATEEGEDIADLSLSLEANINLPPFILVSIDLVKIKVIVDQNL